MTFMFCASEYDPALLAFEHEGVEIRNPFLSPDGLSVVDPQKAYGFEVIDTGGGCKALYRDIPGGGGIVLSDDAGGLPYAREMSDCLIGRWDADGNELACIELGMVPLLTAHRVYRIEVVQVVERVILIDLVAPSADAAKALAVTAVADIQDSDWSSPCVNAEATYPTHNTNVLRGE